MKGESRLSTRRSKMKKPNIVFITCHDLGDYLGCYNTPVSTPNIDRLADEGVQFNAHYSTATICSPSRASIVTGCYPHTNGLMGLVHRGWELDVDRCRPMPALLSDHGYDTHLFGFQHEHWDSYRLGYNKIHEVKSNHCEDVVPVFCDWLEKQEKREQPFLASVGFTEVHRMGMDPSHFKKEGYLPVDPSEVEIRPYLPDIKETREDLADFYGAIRYMDKWIGEMLIAIEKKGERSNTLIVFTTDHGASFYHSKATLYEGGTKVALLMSWKGILPEGKLVNNLTSHVDILPSLLSMLNITIPSYIEGKIFLNEIYTNNCTGRKYVFSERNYTNYFVPSRAVRSDKYRYIANGLRISLFDFLIPEIELSTSDFRKNLDVFNFYNTDRFEEELYDLEKDPGERINLINNHEHNQTKMEMKNILADHLKKTNDPFQNFKNEIMLPENVYSSIRNQKNIRYQNKRCD